MATNPDNVGGLPELPEPTGWVCIDNYRARIEFTNVQHVADEWMQDKRLIVSAVNTADQMRAYGKACVAEYLRLQWNGGLCRAAPAGSGEVEELAKFLDDMSDNNELDACDRDRLFNAAALLRKLQQRAECRHEWHDSDDADSRLPNTYIQQCTKCGVRDET